MSQTTITEIRRKLPILSKKEEQLAAECTVLQLPIDDIIPNRSQPRTAFNQNAIARLADSIRRYGILQPLTVRKILIPPKQRPPLAPMYRTENDDYIPPNTQNPPYHGTPRGNCTVLYELIAGERRLRAARMAQLATVPCIVVNTDDSTSAELAIIENLLREDLNMFEQAEAFRRLMEEFMLTQEEVARRVSLSQSAVANKLRLLKLTRRERETILSSGLTERHARALLKIADQALRADVLTQITLRKLNVSATEHYIDSVLDEIARYRRAPGETPPTINISAISHVEQPSAPPSHQPIQAETTPSFATAEKKPLLKGAIRDIRLFYNSIRNATEILEQAGVRATVQKQENGTEITVTIRLTAPTVEKPL